MPAYDMIAHWQTDTAQQETSSSRAKVPLLPQTQLRVQYNYPDIKAGTETPASHTRKSQPANQPFQTMPRPP